METVKTKILLVEDDPSLGPLLQEYLEAKGFETKLADDGKSGAAIQETETSWLKGDRFQLSLNGTKKTVAQSGRSQFVIIRRGIDL